MFSLDMSDEVVSPVEAVALVSSLASCHGTLPPCLEAVLVHRLVVSHEVVGGSEAFGMFFAIRVLAYIRFDMSEYMLPELRVSRQASYISIEFLKVLTFAHSCSCKQIYISRTTVATRNQSL